MLCLGCFISFQKFYGKIAVLLLIDQLEQVFEISDNVEFSFEKEEQLIELQHDLFFKQCFPRKV